MGGYASSPLYEDTQLGKPALRLWEITANSTRYDKARAASQVLQAMLLLLLVPRTAACLGNRRERSTDIDQHHLQ